MFLLASYSLSGCEDKEKHYGTAGEESPSTEKRHVVVDSGPAQIVFDNTTHDFGTLSRSSSPQKYTFVFVNKGSEPLVINKLESSCHCAQGIGPKTPIQSGDEGHIAVTFNPAENAKGYFKRSVWVHSNAVNQPSIRLILTGTVQ